MERAVRGNGPVYPEEATARLRALLGWKPIPEPERVPAELLPPEVQADPAEVRRLLKVL